MLVNPEFVAMLIRQSQARTEKSREKPLVTKSEKIHKGGSQRTNAKSAEYAEAEDREAEVDYLNARSSNLNFYA